MQGLECRLMGEGDWVQVHAIFRSGIDTGNATFEAAPPASWEKFIAGRRRELCIVAVDGGGTVLGWATASAVSAREIYRGVVELSIYVAPSAAGRGIGLLVLKDFLRRSDESGVWTVQSSVFPENVASLALHKRAGFRVVGTRKAIALMSYGPMQGTWRDTVLLEHRR